MAIKKRKIGTVITEYEVTSYSGPDMKSALKALFESWNEKWDKGGGDYGAVSWDAIELARNTLEHSGDEPFDKDSAADFSKRIVKHHEIAVAAIKRSDADTAARFAYDVGILVAEATMKFRWESHALRGQKQLIAATEGGHSRVKFYREFYRKRNQNWQSEASEIWNRNPSFTKSNVAALIKKELKLDITPGQISRIIKRA